MHLKMRPPPAGKRYVFNEKGQPTYMIVDGKFEPVYEDIPPVPVSEPVVTPHKPKRKGG